MANARIGALRVDLGMNTAAFEKGADLASRKLNAFSKKLDKMGAKMRNVGKNLTLGITAPLAAFGFKATQAAIDAEEMNSAFDVVFGEMSDSVRKWAEETGNAMGRSTQEMQRGALAFEELFSKALDPKDSAEMSKSFAVLTQDLASFKNLSNDVAQQKLFSGLTGEAEPLRAVGVFINAAATEAKALELGLQKVNGKFTDQQKIIARAALIQEQLAQAQGDVLRTSDSTANQLKKAQAAFEELSVVIGTKILPIITPLISKFAEWIDKFTQLDPLTQKIIMGVAAFAAAIGPIVYVAGATATAVAGISTALGVLLPLLAPVAAGIAVAGKALLVIALNPAVLALAGVLGGIYLAWKNWDKIAPILERLWKAAKEFIAGGLTNVLKAVLSPIDSVRRAFFTLYDAVVGNSYVPDMVDGIGEHFARLDKLMVDPAERAARKTKEIFRELASDTKRILERLFPNLASAVSRRNDQDTLRRAFDAGQIDAATLERGLEALRTEGLTGRKGAISAAVVNQGPLAEAEKVEAAGEKMIKATEKLAQKTKTQTVRIAKSFAEMAQEAVQSLQGLISSIKSGGFLDILGSVFGIIDKFGILGGSKGLGGLIGSFAGLFADGGRFPANKFGIVGENGPELFMPGRAGYVVPNSALGKMGGGGGGVTVNVDARGATDPAAIEAAANRAIIAAAPQIVAASEARTVRSLRRPRLQGLG